MTWAVTGGIIGSAVIGGLASNAAADKQGDAVDRGIDAQGKQLAVSRTDLAPYRSAGQTALNALLVRLGLAPGGVDQNSPEFKKLYDAKVADFNAQHLAKYGIGINDSTNQAGVERTLSQFRDEVGAQLAGTNADPNAGSLLKPFTGADLADSPGYKFGLTEGEKAINNLAASRGSYFGGGTAKDLVKYSQDYAGTKFNDAFNQDQATKSLTANLLSGVTNQGVGATNTGVSAGGATTNSIADLMTQGGNASAAGIVGPANAVNSGVGNYINWQNQSRTLDLLRSPSYGSKIAPTGQYAAA